MEVRFFPYTHVFDRNRSDLQRALFDAVASGRFIMQDDLRAFEEELADFCGVGWAIGVGNATDGLELNIRLAGIGTGDEVLLPSHTFVASASAVVAAGAKPVFVEIGEDHLMDADDIEHRITERTRAIMPTQLNGRTADMAAICGLAERHGLVVLEDSAQGLGSRYKGRMAGTFGVAGVFSFYPAKLLGSFGDGGAIIVDDEGLAKELLRLRDHGRDPDTGEVTCWGRNSRLDNVQAAVLRVKLRCFQEEIDVRRQIAERYHQNLGSIPQLRLAPPPDNSANAVHYDVFQNFELEAEDRDDLRKYLAEAGVGTLLQWGGKGVHQFEALGLDQHLPKTEAILQRSFLLPMNSSLTDDQVDYVCEQIQAFYDGKHSLSNKDAAVARI